MADERPRGMSPLEKEAATLCIKRHRLAANTLMREIKEIEKIINRREGGRELSLAYQFFQTGRMYLGEALAELGHQLPEEYRDGR